MKRDVVTGKIIAMNAKLNEGAVVVHSQDADTGFSDVVESFTKAFDDFRDLYRKEKKWPERSIEVWSINQTLMPARYGECGFEIDGGDPENSLAKRIIRELKDRAPEALELWAKEKKPFCDLGLIDDEREVLLVEEALEEMGS